MANLAEYLDRGRGAATALARRAGIPKTTLSAIRNGARRPSPELATRIERATDGEVTAASLLGLETGAGARLQQQNPGHWLVWTGDRGEAPVPPDVLADLGIEPGAAVAFRRTERGWMLTSVERDLRGVQERMAKFARPGGGVVDELIAERREEAKRE